MKNILKMAAVAVFTVALVPVASAQTNTATGVGQAQSSSGSQSGSQSNNQIIFGGYALGGHINNQVSTTSPSTIGVWWWTPMLGREVRGDQRDWWRDFIWSGRP